MTITPIQKRNITYGVVATVVLVGGYFVFFRKKDEGGSGEDPTGNGTITPPNLDFNAKNVANGLLEAMRYWGTDENKIFAVLNNVSQAQFAKVVTAFGNQSYNEEQGNQINWSPFYSLPLRSLKFWLKNELSDDSYETLRLKYYNYL